MEPWVYTSGLPREHTALDQPWSDLWGGRGSCPSASSALTGPISSSLSLEYRCAHALAILDCCKNQMASMFLYSSSCMHPTHLQKYFICSSGENPSVFKGLHRYAEIQNPTAVFEQGCVSKWSVEPFFFQTLPSCPWPALPTREFWSWWKRYDAVVTQACMFSRALQGMWKLLPLGIQTCPVWCFPGITWWC